EELRPGDHRQIHRAEVVLEAGERKFGRLDRAACRCACFHDCDGPAASAQMNGSSKPIVSGPHHYRVKGLHETSSIYTDAYNWSIVIRNSWQSGASPTICCLTHYLWQMLRCLTSDFRSRLDQAESCRMVQYLHFHILRSS